MTIGVKDKKEGVFLANVEFLADRATKKYTFFMDFDVATSIFEKGLILPYIDKNWTNNGGSSSLTPLWLEEFALVMVQGTGWVPTVSHPVSSTSVDFWQ